MLPILLTLVMASTSIPAGHPFIQFMSPEAVQDIPVSVETVRDKVIPFYAELYGVSAVTMDTIVKNESAYCLHQEGDHGTSFGCVQIHLPAHPNISKQQAYSVFFSINYLASELAKGRCHEWSTCPLPWPIALRADTAAVRAP